MECISPEFPRDETEEGQLSFDMDGAFGLWDKGFSYHPYGKPIPFETEGHILSLYPGFDEVSLHVRDSRESFFFRINDKTNPFSYCLLLIFKYVVLSDILIWPLYTQHQKLNLVSSCMTIIMTVAGVNCDAKVLDNEITCRIPKNMTIPSEGLPVKVS